MVVPESRERKRATEDHNHIFFIFKLRLESKSSLLSDSKENNRGLPNLHFHFFFVCEVFSKEGEGNYFYMRHLFYLKPL